MTYLFRTFKNVVFIDILYYTVIYIDAPNMRTTILVSGFGSTLDYTNGQPSLMLISAVVINYACLKSIPPRVLSSFF